MPYFGTLTSRVYTSRGQIPVEDAAVSVVQKGSGGKLRLLSTQLSDESGNVNPVSIETPGTQAGLTPGGETPFVLCDIWVEHPEYEMLIVQDAQIFPDVVSLQELPLIPLPETGGENNGVAEISPQDL